MSRARVGWLVCVSGISLLCATLVCATLVCATPALHAQTDPSLEGSGGWRDVLSPARRRGRALLNQGLHRLVAALSNPDPRLGDASRTMLLAQARMLFEQAALSLPNHPELAYLKAVAVARAARVKEDAASPRRRAPPGLRPDEGAEPSAPPDPGTDFATQFAAWYRARALGFAVCPDQIAFELAVLHTRRHDYDAAAREYRRALAEAQPPTVRPLGTASSAESVLVNLYRSVDRAQVHANLGEVLMLGGHLDEAVHHYERGLALAEPDDAIAYSLALFGLSLALARRGDREEAYRRALQAIRSDPVPADHPFYADLHRQHGAFTVLHLPYVFFDTPYERHAYEALGHEAMAQQGGEQAPALRRTALAAWRRFLTEGGHQSRYRDHAIAHIERLERQGGGGGEGRGREGRAADPRQGVRGTLVAPSVRGSGELSALGARHQSRTGWGPLLCGRVSTLLVPASLSPMLFHKVESPLNAEY